MEIGYGPWEVKFNGQILEGIEAVDVELDRDDTEIDTIDGRRITRTRIRTANVVLQIVDTGIVNLKKILPNNWIDKAEQITGQADGVIVKSEKGAIVYGKPECGEATLSAPIQLIPCENPEEHTVTLFDGVGNMTGVSIEDGVKKLEVTVRSEAAGVLVALGDVDLGESGS